ANQLFGIPTPDEQRGYYEAIIDNINKNGGVACRELVPTYYLVNPTDQSATHQQCLDIDAAGLYAMVDPGGFSTPSSEPVGCLASHHIPYFGGFLLAADFTQRFYPYVFGFGTFDGLSHDTAFALRDRGFFDPAK